MNPLDPIIAQYEATLAALKLSRSLLESHTPEPETESEVVVEPKTRKKRGPNKKKKEEEETPVEEAEVVEPPQKTQAELTTMVLDWVKENDARSEVKALYLEATGYQGAKSTDDVTQAWDDFTGKADEILARMRKEAKVESFN